MKRFGSIYPFLENGWGPRHLGRLVANYEFVKALLTYGTFDEYVFSNSSRANLNAFSGALRTWRLSDAQLSRVRCVPYPALPAVLQAERFHVFHLGGWGWFMPGLHYTRTRYACNPWPITAVTHSLHGPDVVDHAVRLSHAGLAPYDAVFCTSVDARQALRRLLDGGAAIAGRAFNGRLEHLPLGIDDAHLDAAADRDAGRRFRAQVGIAPDATVLLVLGRMTPFQKMDLVPLLQTFARAILPQSARPVTLLLAGSATPDDVLLVRQAIGRYGIQSHVTIRPEFPQGDKAALLAASDILVSPVDNAQETFGLSLLEAMAAGLPVVASRFDGYKDLVRDGVDGFLIDTYGGTSDAAGEWFDLTDPNVAQLVQSQGVAVDLAQLAERVLRLIGDAGLRAAMGAAGRAKVDREYRWSRVIARYEETWDRLAAEALAAGLPPAGDNPYNLGPARIFPHYPSQTLSPDRRLAACGDPSDVRPYEEVAWLVEPPLLARLHACAAAGGEAGAPVADLLVEASLPAPQGEFAVRWMLKYGLLRTL